MASNLPVLAIVGPTGVGKTALAVAIAQLCPAEVVSADSRQVYRGLDIGAAKPTAEERTAVPHHLIDVVDPDEAYTVAQYRHHALAAIGAIRSRGKLAMLVGGTGLYVRAVTEGLAVPAVPPDLTFRAAMEAEAASHGPEALHHTLAVTDPVAAANIDPRNVRRVIRAMEVHRATGTPFSVLQVKARPSFPVLKVGLTLPRDVLYRRVDQRVDAMMAAGLLDEVRRLHGAGYGWELPSMSGLGYRQLGEYLRGERTLEDAVQRIKFDTHAYVRRQYTWFRKDPATVWYGAVDLPNVAAQVLAAVRSASGTNEN